MTVTPETSRLPASIEYASLQKGLSIAVAVLIAFAIIFPRSATTIFLLPVVGGLAVLIFDPTKRGLRLPVNGLLISLVGFSLWSLLSAAWSAAPTASLSKPLFLLGGSIGVAVLAALGAQMRLSALKTLGYGVLAGLAIGAMLVCIETLTDQAITRFLMTNVAWLRQGYEKHLVMENGLVAHVGDGNINRRATVVTMLLIPSALLLVALAEPTLKRAGLAALVAVTAIFLAASTHQSSQAAIIVSAIAWLLALVSPLWARRLIALGWCVSCLLVVPLVIWLHTTGLHKDDNALFYSARHRVVIWNATAEQIRKRPLLGIGADATAVVTETQTRQRQETGTALHDGGFEVTSAHHAHNVFLQVWYELGAVGALLFMSLGLAALAVIGRTRAQVQPFLLAQFASVAGILAFSFSIWQIWFQGAIGLGILTLLISILAIERQQPDAILNDKQRV